MRDRPGRRVLDHVSGTGGSLLGFFKGLVLVVAVLGVLLAVPSLLGSVLPDGAVLPATVVAVAVLAGAGTYAYVGLRDRLAT